MLEDQQTKLFFIIGIEGSGTDLLQKIMNTFMGFCNDKESITYDTKKQSLWTPVRKNQDFANIKKFIKENWTSEFFVERSDDSILCLKELHTKFPHSNYIFLERNPLDIVLSQLNTFNGGYDILERHYQIDNLMMGEDDLILNREQYYSKNTLKKIFLQSSYKKEFKNSITVKYEFLIKSLRENLLTLEKAFGIKANFDEANRKMSLNSPLIGKTRPTVIKLEDEQALAMIKTASRLWNYY